MLLHFVYLFHGRRDVVVVLHFLVCSQSIDSLYDDCCYVVFLWFILSTSYPSSSFEQTAVAVQGIEQIRARVSELDLAGARVDLTDGSMDAQVRR